jgi:hypothetical protein
MSSFFGLFVFPFRYLERVITSLRHPELVEGSLGSVYRVPKGIPPQGRNDETRHPERVADEYSSS